MKWFTKCIKNYAVFKGRAVRSEFWYFVLVSVIIQISLLIIDVIIGWDEDGNEYECSVLWQGCK